MGGARDALRRQRLQSEWTALPGAAFGRGTGGRSGARVRVVLLYPSPYPVAMSSLGFQAVYRALAGVDGVACDRAFLPDEDPGAASPIGPDAAGGRPLAGFATGTPVSAFDLVGVSLAYELELVGLVRCLRLAGMSPLAAGRDPRDPPVVLGGPLTFSNPLPAYPFADVVVLGEAEAAGPALVRLWLEAGGGKARFLEAVAGAVGAGDPAFAGVVVPALDGPLLRPLARAPDDLLPARSAFITPHTELSSMFLIEPERGCHRPCTYCVMRRPDAGDALLAGGGMRTLAPERVLSLVPADAPRVGLVGAAVTDHPRIRELVRAVVEAGKGVGISSLRADRLDDELVDLLRRGGCRTLTTASDGASERLRKLVQRGTKERHLVRSAELVRDHGLRELKLYMMLGLPTETDADVDELADFSLHLRSIARLSLSIAPFVSKRNTPLAGLPFAGVRAVEGRITRLKARLKGRVQVRPTSARWASVEHRLAQAGVEGARAAVLAADAGGAYADWVRAFAALDGVPPEA